MTPLMSAAKALKPDLIAFGGHDEELINLVKALGQIDFTPKSLLMHYGVTEPAFVEALGKNADQVLGGSVWTCHMDIKGQIGWPDGQGLRAAALAEYKVPSDYTQAGCSAAGLAFEAALKNICARRLWTRRPGPSWWGPGEARHSDLLRSGQVRGRGGLLPLQRRFDAVHGADPRRQGDGGCARQMAQAKLLYPLKPWEQR